MNINDIHVKSVIYNCLTENYEGVTHQKILSNLSIVQAIEGSYDISLNNGKTFSTGEGGVFIAPSNVVQKITHHNGKNGVMKAHWVFIDAVINNGFKFDDVFNFPIILPKRENEKVYKYLIEISNATNYFSKIISTFNLLNILYAYRENTTKLHPIKSKIESFVQDNYVFDIKAKDIAKHLYCSTAQTFRYVKKFFGLSPANYINGIRFKNAEYKLLTTTDAINEIATSVGFADYSYFSKLFKIRYGYSPTEYRKKFS